MNEEQARSVVDAHVDRSKTKAAFARENGFNIPYLNDVLKGRRPLPDRLLDIVGLERAPESYRKKERA